jgi:DNA-binding winged helix-turn-helix (wHTH) protein/Tfp pilus assembly protein PilF
MRTDAAANETPHRGYRFGPFCLDIDRAALLKNGKTVRLRRQSFDVLLYLIERHGRLVEKEELLQAIWGNTPVTDDSLTHCLIDIRKVLGDSQHELIRTVPRRGFIFDIPVHTLQERSKRSYVTMAIAACLVAAVTFMAATKLPYLNDANRADPQVLVNIDALGLYKQARFLFNRRGPNDMEKARQYYLQAIDIDPDYADAWAGVAATHYIDLTENRADESKLAVIKAFAEKAIAIDPDNAEGHFRLASYYGLTDDDEAAERHLKYAFAKHPNDPLILTVMAGFYEQRGEIELAIEASYKAVKADPLAVTYRGNLASYLLFAGRYEEAIEQSVRASTLSGSFDNDYGAVEGLALIKLERYREALEVASVWPHMAEKYQVIAMANFGLDQTAKARSAIRVLNTFPEASDVLLQAELQAYCNEIDLSFQTLTAVRRQLLVESLYAEMDSQIEIVERSPFMGNVRADSRWGPWLAETREMMNENLVLSFR